MTASQTIAGWSFSLTPGRRYLASRPMATAMHGEGFPVTIRDITDGFPGEEIAVSPIGPLAYEAANEFLDAFNLGPVSFAGRIWE